MSKTVPGKSLGAKSLAGNHNRKRLFCAHGAIPPSSTMYAVATDCVPFGRPVYLSLFGAKKERNKEEAEDIDEFIASIASDPNATNFVSTR